MGNEVCRDPITGVLLQLHDDASSEQASAKATLESGLPGAPGSVTIIQVSDPPESQGSASVVVSDLPSGASLLSGLPGMPGSSSAELTGLSRASGSASASSDRPETLESSSSLLSGEPPELSSASSSGHQSGELGSASLLASLSGLPEEPGSSASESSLSE